MYHFVFQGQKSESSEDRRRAELQNSDARSHAAKIAHLKRKARLHIAQLDPRDLTKPSEEEAARLAGIKKDALDSSKFDSWHEKGLVKYQPPKVQVTDRQSNIFMKSGRAPKLGPGSLLAQTTRDPFDSYPERRLPEIVERVVQYAFDSIWPTMLCAVRGENLAVAKREWRHHGLDDELLFHVQVALACGLNLALQSIPKTSEALSLIRLTHYSKGIRLLKRRIESLDGPASEDLMMSMLVLGVNADVASAQPDVHPQSPLATSQYMHLYGRLTLMPSYATALHHVVEARGGILALKHLALADWLLLSDLSAASRTGDRLLYPRIRPYRSILSSGKHIPDVKAILLSEKLGSGFHAIDDALLNAGIREAMSKGVEATVALDHYHRYENGQPRLVDVMVAANEAHHAFLELRSKDRLGMEQLAYSCCRLAMLIYSDMVLYPMPTSTRIKPRLACELRQLLEDFEEETAILEELEAESSTSDMVMWALVMGGIASSFTEHRSWFEDRLRTRLAARTKADAAFEPGSWVDFKERVSKFLWWDPVVDSPAMDLWEDVTT